MLPRPLEEIRAATRSDRQRFAVTAGRKRTARSWVTAIALFTGPARPTVITLEDSIYVKPGSERKGIGKAVLAELITRCTALKYRQIIAVIGDSANAASIAVHASLGFVRAGNLRSTGYKFGRWVDSVLMQLPLGEGDGTKP